jgi:hypothetical protein
MQVHKLDERVHSAEVQIDVHKKKIKEMGKNVVEIRAKTFLQRLLRR